jgi:hypothetical protein
MPIGAAGKQACHFFVMAGLVPAIHDFLCFGAKDVDARHEAEHDVK